MPFYAVLRSVVSKLLGIVLLACVFLVLALLPFFVNCVIRSSMFKPFNAFFVWGFFFICLSLGWIGGLPVIEPYVDMGFYFTVCYFFVLIVCFPLASWFDKLVVLSYFYERSNFGFKRDAANGCTQDCVIMSVFKKIIGLIKFFLIFFFKKISKFSSKVLENFTVKLNNL